MCRLHSFRCDWKPRCCQTIRPGRCRSRRPPRRRPWLGHGPASRRWGSPQLTGPTREYLNRRDALRRRRGRECMADGTPAARERRWWRSRGRPNGPRRGKSAGAPRLTLRLGSAAPARCSGGEVRASTLRGPPGDAQRQGVRLDDRAVSAVRVPDGGSDLAAAQVTTWPGVAAGRHAAPPGPGAVGVRRPRLPPEASAMLSGWQTCRSEPGHCPAG